MQDLPDHVWSLVFDHLECPVGQSNSTSKTQFDEPETDGLAALSRLCRTSSRFLSLAQRVLYRHLPLNDWNIRERLLSTLHQHTHLAECVQNVTLGEGVFNRDEITSLLLPYYSQTLKQTSSQSKGLEAALRGLLDGPEWSDNVPDMWFAHCVTLLPNLKLLDYSTRSWDKFFPAIIRQAAKPEAKELVAGPQALDSESQQAPLASVPQQCSSSASGVLPSSPQPLSKLVEFSISNQDTEMAVRLDYIQELFLLPRLKVFRGCAVDLNTTLAAQVHTPEQGTQQSSSLKHAYFTDSLAEADGICDLLRACPSLQTFSLSWGSSTVGDSYLDFDHIGRVLREHGTSLEVLELDCRECFSYVEEETEGKIGNLKVLKHLKHLSVPEAVLLGGEDELSEMDKVGDDDDDDDNGDGEDPVTAASLEPLLPESLETLRLYSGYDEKAWVQNSVQGVLASPRLSQLKKLQLDHAAELGIDWDVTGWRSKKVSGHLVFYR